jgi:dTDP-glucose pyrophosphorylase
MSSNLVGVIPAAGRGTRAYPSTKVIPKAMLDICGQPVLDYTLAIIRDQLGIRDVIIILGQQGDAIRRRFGNGDEHSVRIRYVQNDRVDLGLAHSVLLAREHVPGSHFALMLSDELYWGSNHQEILRSNYERFAATIVVRPNSTNREIRKNFSVEMQGETVLRLVEKPAFSANGLLGCGTYVFSREIFDVLQRRYDRAVPHAGDLTAAINDLISTGGRVQQFTLASEYININYEEDIHHARSIVRRSRLDTAKVSLVMPCESSHDVIGDMLRMARRHRRVTEVVLVARQDDAELARLAATYQATMVIAAGLSRRAFGDLFRAGIAHATGDVIMLTMDDDSFDPGDIDKLLAYMGEADLVLGTRTTSQLVQQGSNLQWVARMANYALAKLIEALWLNRRARLTDVGCVFRAFWRDTYDQIAPEVRSPGPAFAPEMIIEALRHRLWVIEIPINYCRATEESRIRVEHRNVGVFLSMARMILSKRFLGGQ